MQVTCRDRNRIALQSDLLAAHALGVRNVLTMTGDTPAAGDHPDAQGVFDVDGNGLLAGRRRPAIGPGPRRPIPCVAHLTFVSAPWSIPVRPTCKRNSDACATKWPAAPASSKPRRCTTRAAFAAFMQEVQDDKVSILASCIVLRSANMARRMNTVPGISIPEPLIQEMEDAADPARQGIAIAGRIIRELRNLAHGVHLIAIGQENRIPEILDEAGLSGRG